jgi:hypothetical protein
MAIPLVGGAIGPMVNFMNNVIDKIVPDKDLKIKYKKEIEALARQEAIERARIINLEDERDTGAVTAGLQAQRDVILAEAQSGHWFVAAWRPILMGLFIGILGNNYILAPYTNMLFHLNPSVPLPPEMWETLQIGIGGYVGGRSLEKIAKIFRGKVK